MIIMEPSDVDFHWNDSYCNNGISDAYSNYRGVPKITQIPDDESEIEEGDDWKWCVRIKGLKPITVELYHNGTLRDETTYNGRMTMFRTIIRDVTADDEGSYELVVSNRRGTVSINHELYVI